MNLVLYKHHSFIHCFVLNLKDQTYSTESRKTFLEIDVKGGERYHIKAYHLQGRKRSPGGENTQGSQMLDIQEERHHMSFWGKDMFMCLFALCSIHSYISALNFCSLSSPNIPCQSQGEQDI